MTQFARCADHSSKGIIPRATRALDSSFQLNNWYGNPTKDVDTASGADGNFSGSWFERGAPTAGPGANLTLENLAAERIMQAGPRP